MGVPGGRGDAAVHVPSKEVVMELAGDDPSALADLAAFLAAPERAKGTLSYHAAQGFLFAVATAPELVPPSEWLPAVWGENEPLEGPNEAGTDRVLAGLMTLYNRINGEVQEGRVGLPADLALEPEPWANLGPEAPLGRWSWGFSRGMGLVEEVWDGFFPWMPEGGAGAYVSAIVQLSLFTGQEYGQELVRALDPEGPSLEGSIGSAHADFEETMATLAWLGRLTAQGRDQELEGETCEPLPPPQRVRREKIGRNEPCPCGSGKKYKKCCGARV
jgi:uncharacterized protein